MKPVLLFLLILGYLFGYGSLQGTHDARLYITAVGVREKLSDFSFVINVKPCGNQGEERFIRFTGKYKSEALGTRICNNGKHYEAVRVTQCGGANDNRHPICKTVR